MRKHTIRNETAQRSDRKMCLYKQRKLTKNTWSFFSNVSLLLAVTRMEESEKVRGLPKKCLKARSCISNIPRATLHKQSENSIYNVYTLPDTYIYTLPCMFTALLSSPINELRHTNWWKVPTQNVSFSLPVCF